MAERRWLDRTQPQTLYIAVILMYINAALTLLFGGLFSRYGLLLVVGYVAAGYGIANEKKWGYGLGLAMAFLPFLLQIILFHNPFAADFITLLFEIALVALLLHPQSREYQRIWFK
jgi:Kef-type K+ transport system membrane component KefB